MRINIKEWLLIVSAFILFFYLYSLFSYFGIEDFIKDGALKDYFDTYVWHLEIIVTGVLFGTLFILINQLTEKKIFRRRSFGFNILLKSTLYIIALSIVGLVLFNLFSIFGLISQDLLENYTIFLSFKLISSFLIYWMLFVLLINFIISVRNKFGPRTMIELLTGKYYHPRSEELVFLFLDLEDSTRITEKLGHKNYSRFIKQSVHELTPIILRYKARVYQYVGDEVILYWKIKEGLKQLNALESFFQFSKILKLQKDAFRSKYGEVPKFKAGMDAGIVTLTEIGDIKREIAFHGDVLNTAARLEKKCKEFNEDFIVSQHVIDRIGHDNKYHFKLLNDFPLRGKTESLKFYSVSFK